MQRSSPGENSANIYSLSLLERDHSRVRTREFRARGEDRLPARDRQGVGEAVAVVQRGWMPSLAKGSIAAPGFLCLVCVDRHDRDRARSDDEVELTGAGIPQTRLDDDPCFDEGRC